MFAVTCFAAKSPGMSMAPSANVLATQSSVERLERDGRGVFVKRFHTSGWQQTPEIVRARIAREADLLNRMQRDWPTHNQRLGCVECLEADPAALRMTLAEAPGETLLAQVVRSSRWNRPPLSAAPAYLAGRWLRALQTLPFTAADAEPLNDDPDDLVAYCELRLDRLRQQRPDWLSTTQRDRVKSLLERLVQRASHIDLRRVWSHADFYPGNIIWDGHTLTPIDLSMCRLDYPLADLSYFVHCLYILRIQFPWGRWPVVRWEEAILRGIGRPGAHREPMYQALMIRQMLCKLTGLARERAHGAAAMHNRWIANRARERLAALVQQGEEN